jgi:hypothetical protein
MSLPVSSIRDIVVHRTGLRSFTTPRGIRVMELDLTANPMHTPEWIQAARTRYSSEREWRREMMRDWTTPSGDPYFPEFVEIGVIRFIRPVTRLIKGPVYRSYDFGKRCPACTWFQYSQKGAKPSGGHCPPPWFPLGTHFIDITGKEALQGQSNAILPELATVQGIFSEMGMNLIIQNPRVMARYQVMRRFLRVYDDGLPGLLIDPQCEEAIDMFSGKLCYPDATPANPVPTKPKNDGHLINLSDAFTYGVVMVAPADAPKEAGPQRLVGYRGGRTPVYAEADSDSVGWHETRPKL